MVSRAKERTATGAVGLGAVGVGGAMRHAGVERAHWMVGKPEPRLGKIKFKGLQVARIPKAVGRGKARALYGAGTALGLAGAPAVGVALSGHVPARRGRVDKADRSAKTFLGSGLQGTKDAAVNRAENIKARKPAKATAVASGVTLGAGALGSLAAHRGFDRLARAGSKAVKLRPSGTAIAGTLAGAASYGVANRALKHTGAGEYQVTPSGVKRKRKAPVPASRMAQHIEGRSSHGADARAFRSQVVGKNDPGGSDIHVPGTMSRVRPLKNFGNTKKLTVKKSVNPGMTREQSVRQLQARKHKLHTDAVTTGLGMAGVGLLAARHIPKIAVKHPNLEHHALTTAIASGGVGAVGGIQGLRINRRDVKAQEKALSKAWLVPAILTGDEALPIQQVAKASWGPQIPRGLIKPKTMRQSYVATRRYAGGTLKAARVSEAIA